MKKFCFVSFIVTALLSVTVYFVIAFTAEGRLMRQNAEALSGDVVAWGKCGGEQNMCFATCENCGQVFISYDENKLDENGDPMIRTGSGTLTKCTLCGTEYN